MKTRPKINLELSQTDQVLEMAGWFALFVMWGLVLFSFGKLPETIPTHFNLAGEADAFGSKMTIFLLPTMGTATFAGLTILSRYPHLFNYPVEITAENARRQYTLATRLIRYLKVAVLIIFSFITFTILQTATRQTTNVGKGVLIITIVLIFVPLVLFLIKAFRK